jgi:TonB family protein
VGSHKTPTITDLKLDVGAGLDQLFTSASGKVSRGQEVILLARTHHPLPGSVKVSGKLGGKPFARSYEVDVEDGKQHAYVPTLWARRYLAELLGADRRKNRGAIINLGLEYALMTPHTSLLVLDSEAAYERSGIKRKPRDKLWGAAPRAALELATLPLALFGCSKGSKSLAAKPQEQRADEIPDWLKKRAPRRHKGDEGKMGSRKARLSVQGAYGLRGPGDNKDPRLAKRLSEDAAKNGGVLGVVGKKRDPSQIASIFGRDTALGSDSEDSLGGLIGNQVGGAHGIGGLGTLGTVGAGRAMGLRTLGTLRAARSGRLNVKAGRATVRGSLDREIVRRVIRRHLNEVKYCYQKQLQSDPGLAGKLKLGFVISATGQVVRSRVLQSSLGNKPVETCVASAVKRWLFPKPKGGGVVGVSYPFTFWNLGGKQIAAKQRALEQKQKQAAAKQAATKKKKALAKKVLTLRVCSDAARRPLWHRRAIWLQRLERTRGVKDWTRVFRDAWSRCELPSWRDRKLLLDLVQQRVSSGQEVQVLLATLPGRRARDFVRRRLLRRAVTRELARAPGLADHDLDWSAAEASLAKLSSPTKRVALLRWLCDKHPGSAGCTLRLVRALIEAEQSEDALNLALRSRRAALVTPDLMEQLGDLLVASGQAALATRIYSEIVEYAPEDAAARRRLGDIYLRHGWYEPAYQQYRTLVALLPDEPLATLRLAAAAAGIGRVDEALRLERRVAAGEGEPGPRDPRRWARMLSAARIARLMLKHRGGKSETLRQSLRRSLSRLQVLPPSRGALVLLTWEDLDASLGAGQGQDKPAARGRWQHLLNGRAAGLVALSTSGSSGGELVLPVRRSGVVVGKRAVSFQVTTIRLEGKAVRVANQRGTLSPGQAKVTLTLPAPAKRARRAVRGEGGQPS